MKKLAKIKNNTFEYLDEIEKGLIDYPYEKNPDQLFKINDYEIFELQRLDQNL